MSPVAIVVTFFLTWWVMIFLVVPSSNYRKVAGTAYPDNPRMGQKILITSVISMLLTLAIWGAVRLDIVSFRQWAKHWDQEEGMSHE